MYQIELFFVFVFVSRKSLFSHNLCSHANMAQSESTKVWLLKATGQFVLQQKEISTFGDIQSLVGGFFECKDLCKKGGITYSIAMNENGLNLNLPTNKNLSRWIPDLPPVVGDVVVMATNQDGEDVNIDISPKQIGKLSKSYLKKQEQEQLAFFKKMDEMGVKIVRM